MKLLVAAIFAFLAVSAFAEDNWDIDFSTVVPVVDLPGFWDGRDAFKPLVSNDFNRDRRIVGGIIVTPNSHPYQAGLLMAFGTGTGLCGGSIISPRNVLTAAHCLQGSSSTQVILGAHQITTVEVNQLRLTVTAANYRLHEDYNPQTLVNDVALLHLPTVVAYNAFIQPSTLPTDFASELFVGDIAVATGWGRTSDTVPGTSPVLRSVDNPIITNAACQAVFGSSIIASTICISTTGGRNVCSGDSGGPLTVVRGGQNVQVGIAVFVASAGCAAGFPGGFARVTSFLTWIDTHSAQ